MKILLLVLGIWIGMLLSGGHFAIDINYQPKIEQPLTVDDGDIMEQGSPNAETKL